MVEESFKTQAWINTRQSELFRAERQLSLGPLAEIPVEIEIKVDAPNDALFTSQGRSDALGSMEWAIQLFANKMNHAFADAQQLVTGAGVQWQEGRELFPWLPWPDRNVQVQLGFGFFTSGLDVTRSLTEQTVSGVSASPANVILQSTIFVVASLEGLSNLEPYMMFENRVMRPLFTLELASVVVESATFKEGSLWAKVKAKLRVVAIALPLILPLMGSPVQPLYDRWDKQHQFEQKIETSVAGQQCTVYATWKFDAETLRGQSLNAFNPLAPGLTAAERSMRMCNVQLAMKVDQGSPEKIDGQWGPATKEGLEYFAKRHNVPADLNSEVTRGALREVFWNR